MRASLDLELAWRRVLTDARDDLVPDPLSYEDFIPKKAEILGNVRKKLQRGYSPSSLLHMDVPKSKLAMRPGSVPAIEDRLVYTAVVGSFAEGIDGSLEDESIVPSYRVASKRKKYLFKFGIKQWFKFQDLMRQAYSDGYKYALVTDLTAYFDHINHELLLGQLRSLGVPDQKLTLLKTLLDHWSEGRPVGIPQGLDPSSLLGNVYLDPLDKHMVRGGHRYFRYVDDIRVFAKSEADLRRSMLEITRQTRALGLHVQTGKTNIFQDEEILDLVNERQTQLGAIDYHLDYGDTDMAEEEIQRVLRDLMKRGQFNERHFRKCLNGLRKLESGLGVAPTLQRLDTLEPWAQSVSEYLSLFAKSHASIKRRIMELLMDRDRNIFEWPEYWLVRTLRNAASLPRDFLDWCGERIQDPTCHWNCRGQYALVLGTHGDLADRRLVLQLIPSRDNDYERRAFVASLKNLPEPEKGKALQRLQRDYPSVEAALALAA